MRKIILLGSILLTSTLSFAVNSIGNGKIAINTTDTSVNYITMNATNIVISTPAVIQGSISANTDTQGAYGEFASTATTANFTAGTSTQYTNIVSTTLSAGIWDCSALGITSGPGVAGWTDVSIAISSFSANTTTDHVSGYNVANFTAAFGNNDRQTLVIPRYRVSLSGPTTIYLKQEQTYSPTAPSMRFSSLTCTRAR